MNPSEDFLNPLGKLNNNHFNERLRKELGMDPLIFMVFGDL